LSVSLEELLNDGSSGAHDIPFPSPGSERAGPKRE
jgi:hypothetical protein